MGPGDNAKGAKPTQDPLDPLMFSSKDQRAFMYILNHKPPTHRLEYHSLYRLNAQRDQYVPTAMIGDIIFRVIPD